MRLQKTLPLIVALATLSGVGRAQDDPRKAQAEAVFMQGLKEHDAQHEEAALAKFEEAYRIYPSPNVLFNIGREQHLIGKALEAIRNYRSCLSNPLLNPSNASLARTFVAELQTKLGRIDVVAPIGAKISIDGSAQFGASPFDVPPGDHDVVIVAKNGKSAEKKAHLDAGDSIGIDVTAELAGDQDGTFQQQPRRKNEEAPKIIFPPPTGALVVGGVGLVGIGVGVIFGIESMSKHDSAQSQEAAQPCASPSSSACQQLQDTNSSIHSASTVSIASYVVGGILVAGGVVWWVAAPKHERPTARISPWVGPKNAGFGLSGTF